MNKAIRMFLETIGLLLSGYLGVVFTKLTLSGLILLTMGATVPFVGPTLVLIGLIFTLLFGGLLTIDLVVFLKVLRKLLKEF